MGKTCVLFLDLKGYHPHATQGYMPYAGKFRIFNLILSRVPVPD